MPAQLDKLVTSQLGLLAQRRLARGVKLNHAEATVRICTRIRTPGSSNDSCLLGIDRKQFTRSMIVVNVLGFTN